MDGIDVIVHAASNKRGQGKGDADAVWRLIEAAKRGGRRPHLVFISIVGVDRHPSGYYQAKYEAEQTIEASGLPHTVQRTTQWFQLLDTFLTIASKSPVVPVPSIPFQPLDAREVAGRMADLATGEPMGRAEDMGGPEVLDAGDIAQAYLRATGKRRLLVPLRVPGKSGTGVPGRRAHLPGEPAGQDHVGRVPGGRVRGLRGLTATRLGGGPAGQR